MLTAIRSKSQITIPKDIVLHFGLQEGDQLDITEENGTIRMIPVAVYPKAYVTQLNEEIEQLKSDIKSGKQFLIILMHYLQNWTRNNAANHIYGAFSEKLQEIIRGRETTIQK